MERQQSHAGHLGVRFCVLTSELGSPMIPATVLAAREENVFFVANDVAPELLVAIPAEDLGKGENRHDGWSDPGRSAWEPR
jgi:hypothetical protein